MKNRRLPLLLFVLLMPLAMWGQKTLPYEYGFENNDLATEGWMKNSPSSNTGISSNAKRTGNYGFRFYYNADPQYLISPELSTTTGGVTVEFYYKTSSTYFSRTFQVGYSTTTTDISAFVFGDEISASDAEWALFSQDFPSGTKYIAIKHENTSYGNLYLDDFNFEECSEYPAPKNLVLTAYTSSTATFDWTGRNGQDHWDIYCSTNTTAPTESTTPTVSNTETKPYTLTGLVAGETYYAYVRGNYNNGEHFSDWSNACLFEVGCFTPMIGQSMATCNQVYFSWNPVGAETSWQVTFSDQQGFNPDAITPETVTTHYYVKEELATGVTYYARVRAVCGEGDYSDWSEEVSMTTECFAPSNLQESSVTPTTVTLAWTQGSNESQWQISYSTTENFIPENGTIETVNTKPFTLSGLTVNTQYYARVRAVCGENIYSEWSAICAFMPKYELTVGNGTNYNAYIPVSTSAIDYTSKCQFIVPAADLASLLYANISKMTFHATSETGTMGTATFDVFISELNGVTSFESYEFFDWSEMTTVYSGSLSVSGSKMEVTLTAPYQYMGGDLLIGFSQTASGSTNSYFGWYGAETTDYCAYGGYEMTAYSYTDYSRYKFMPKTTFSYTPGTAPTCMKPSNLIISQTSSSAILTWTAGDDETHWNVQYKTVSASEWSPAIAVENTPTYTITNLSPITSYQVRVQADCGGGDKSGWIAGSFTTSCGPTNVPYSHDFDSDATGSSAAFPQCWTKYNDSDDSSYNYYPYVMGSNSHSGSNCLFFMRLYDYTALNQVAVLPEMNADVRTLQLSFYARLGSGTNQSLSVGVMTDPDDASTFVKIEDVTVASNEYAQYTVSFDTYEGNGHYIALKCERGSAYNQIYVDDVEVIENSICFAPENPQISDVTANSAVFTWTPGSTVTHWQVQYKKTADADWSESVAVNGTPSYILSGLAPATEYQARVRTDCGSDNYSDWVTSDPFQTECGYMTLPYSHDFDSDATGHVAPTCWHFSDGSYPYIYESNTNAHSGNHYLQIKKNTDYAATLVLPEINTDEHPISTLKLTFWAKAGSSTSYYDYLYAGVMTDPNDMSTFQSVQGASTNLSTTTYKEFELYFDNWSGEGKYIALRYGGNTTYHIDDIEVSVAPTCRQPLDLSGNYSSAHEANIRWKTRDLHQCNYQVSYSTTEGFNPENGTIVDVAFETTLVNAGTNYRYYDLTCLDANTTYYFYVRANCGNGAYSEWSDDYASFTTGEACQGPDNVMIDAKNTYVRFEWLGDIDTEWEFQYKESSSETWITPSDFAVTPGSELYLTYTLHGLTRGISYDARLRKHCGMFSCPEVDDGYSDWYEMNFSTYDGCWDGDPWMCTSHLGTKATLRWLNSGPDMRWQIRYRLSYEGYQDENIVTTDVLPEATMQQYTLTGLEKNSTYYWQVRGYCSDTEQGDWSDEDYFFTRSTDGFITVDKTHPYYENFENGMPEDWSRMNLYNYDMEHYDTWECVDASSGTWEQFPPSMCISSCRECMSWASPGSMILMPAIYIDENATSAVLSFWSKDAYNANDARGTKMVWVNGNYLSTEYTAFDLGCIYQRSSKANYWRQCFVNLDDYIGDTVIIAFDYVVTHNYNNYDWWVDDVRVQVFDKVGGAGSDVTEGSWDNSDFWGGSVPNSDDDVIINANVIIPDGVVAAANQIVINTDTTNTDGNRVEKYGKLIVADGGQLKTNHEVKATIQKTINGYTRGGNGWYLIAPPVQEELDPEDVEGVVSAEGNYDLYAFDGNQQHEEWRNYKQESNAITFQNGQGYLYANSLGCSPAFVGTVLPSNQTKTVDLDYATTTFGKWNLVGNPFACDAYLQGNPSFYKMNAAGTELIASSGVVKPMEGVFVQATGEGQQIVFTTAAPEGNSSNGYLHFSLSKNDRADASNVIDCVGIRFDEGQPLPKFQIHENSTKVYIPQDGQDYAIVSIDGGRDAMHCVSTTEIPINFKANENGEYTLTVSTTFHSPLSTLHLIDHLTGAVVNLLSNPSYTFTAKTTDYASRFKLVFSNDNENEDFAYISNGNLNVNGTGTIQVIDVLGRVIFSKELSTLNSQLSTLNSPGVYVLRLINGDNVKTQKIIVK